MSIKLSNNAAKQNPPTNVAEHMITPHRGVTAPRRMVIHLNSVQAQRVRSRAVPACSRFSHKSTVQERKYTENRLLTRMHTVPLGIENNSERLQTAVRLMPSAAQGKNSFSGTGRIKSVLQEEISSLLEKTAIRVVPLEKSHRGFYSRFILVQKKRTQYWIYLH